MKKIIILVCVALTMIVSGFIVLNAADFGTSQVINEPYDYSDAEWLGEGNNGIAVGSFSLPEEMLKKMSTSALVDTVLNLPEGFLTILTIAQSTSAPYEYFLNNYNVLTEISSRADKDQYIDKYVDDFNKGDKTLKSELFQYINLLEYCR